MNQLTIPFGDLPAHEAPGLSAEILFTRAQLENLPAHPVAALFPMMVPEEGKELAEDIQANGLEDAVTLVDTPEGPQIADGRNRVHYTLEHGGWERLHFERYTGADLVGWILRKNLKRRHLTESQRALLAAELVKIMRQEKEARKDQAAAGAATDPTAETTRTEPEGKTRDRAAAIMNVSPRAVQAGKAVLERGTTELKDAVRDGKIGVTSAEQVADLPPDQQKDIVARGEKAIKSKAKELRKAKESTRRAERLAKIEERTQEACDLEGIPHRYPVLYTDNPWAYSKGAPMDRNLGNPEEHYPTLTSEELARLPVDRIAARSCVLFAWVPMPKLKEAFAVFEAWGFQEYKTGAVWDKDPEETRAPPGMGYWFEQDAELLLIFTRGDVPCPLPEVRRSSMIRWRKGRHSEKPEEARELINQYFPTLRKLELFARAAAIGWDSWGNELGYLQGTGQGTPLEGVDVHELSWRHPPRPTLEEVLASAEAIRDHAKTGSRVWKERDKVCAALRQAVAVPLFHPDTYAPEPAHAGPPAVSVLLLERAAELVVQEDEDDNLTPDQLIERLCDQVETRPGFLTPEELARAERLLDSEAIPEHLVTQLMGCTSVLHGRIHHLLVSHRSSTCDGCGDRAVWLHQAQLAHEDPTDALPPAEAGEAGSALGPDPSPRASEAAERGDASAPGEVTAGTCPFCQKAVSPRQKHPWHTKCFRPPSENQLRMLREIQRTGKPGDGVPELAMHNLRRLGLTTAGNPNEAGDFYLSPKGIKALELLGEGAARRG